MRYQILVTLIVLGHEVGCDLGVPGSAPPFLYERMGGQAVVSATVDSFYAILKADPAMWRTFKPAFEDESGQRATRFKTMMESLMCHMAQGDCWYEGMSMSSAHANMDVTELEFDTMMEHLDRALKVNNVGVDERKEMVALFSSMKYQIVR